eukprot:jgi/Tetstr1/438405/TSEL_026971.t1
MAPPKELITLQFGSYANYVGAHYWNVAEELLGLQACDGASSSSSAVSTGVVYRSVEDHQGSVSYHPRLILFDMCGSLGGLNAAGEVGTGQQAADVAAAAATWDGGVVTCESERVEASWFVSSLAEEEEGSYGEDGERDDEADMDQHGDYSDGEGGPGGGRASRQARGGGIQARAGLDAAAHKSAAADEEVSPVEEAAAALDAPGGVRYWTDYLKAVLHPRSLGIVKGVWAGADVWGGYGEGAGALAGEEAREEALDRVRFFAEECDSLQGFQVMAEDLGGWGRVAADVLAELREDYANKKVLLFSVRAPIPPSSGEMADVAPSRSDRCWPALNRALSTAALSESVSLYIPLECPPPAVSAPLLHWDRHQAFHTSALCAAAMDTATLPFRLQPGQHGADDMDAWLELATGGRSHRSMTLSSLFGHLPAPQLASAHDIAAAADQRRRDAGSNAPCALRGALAFSEGHPCASGRDLRSESVVLRGLRTADSRAARAGEAQAALDEWLLTERLQLRALRHRCVAPQALPVPLPFPNLFSPALSRSGDAAAHMVSPPPPPRGRLSVASLPVLTRLQHSGASRAVLGQQVTGFREARRSAAGSTTLSAWGYSREDLDEVEERVHDVIGTLPQALFGSDSDESMGEDEGL